MEDSKKIAVIGGGSWATALVKILCNNLSSVNWWMRNEGAVAHILKYRHNPNYLQSVEFDLNKINVSTDLVEIIRPADIVIIASPSAFLTKIFEIFPQDLMKDKIVFSAVKGIIPEFNAIPARFIHKTFGTPYDNIGIICGPCHAEEVALERLSYLTIAGQDDDVAEEMAELLACRYIKTTVSDDLFGTELSAVLKNVYAIASGICSGLGYGDNFQSSRNRSFGFMIGKGYSVKTAQLEMDMIAEGYYAAKCVMEINKKFQVEMPIVEAVFNILYEQISPAIEMRILTDKLT